MQRAKGSSLSQTIQLHHVTSLDTSLDGHAYRGEWRATTPRPHVRVVPAPRGGCFDVDCPERVHEHNRGDRSVTKTVPDQVFLALTGQ